MSRIGRTPIAIPAGVEVTLGENNHVTVKGPKGTVERTLNPHMTLELENGHLLVKRPNDEQEMRAMHGLTRALLHDMVVGVSEGFSKTLEIQGIGYRAAKEGNNLVMNLGFSHQVIVPEIEGITIEVPDANHVVIKGIDKQKVGQFAADTRKKRPPEPYKGKGIRYQGEVVRIKEGKTGAK
ncbi:MAG: 50S ribosomal protein L6 [Oscillospiraceae bacterium]|nr:50S ribosomal protein L6 [Oscillospiraceae bacterium]MBR6208447.1 50S ribosomal protein L6 [Oscillospiraceae bacterium]